MRKSDVCSNAIQHLYTCELTMSGTLQVGSLIHADRKPHTKPPPPLSGVDRIDIAIKDLASFCKSFLASAKSNEEGLDPTTKASPVHHACELRRNLTRSKNSCSQKKDYERPAVLACCWYSDKAEIPQEAYFHNKRAEPWFSCLAFDRVTCARSEIGTRKYTYFDADAA